MAGKFKKGDIVVMFRRCYNSGKELLVRELVGDPFIPNDHHHNCKDCYGKSRERVLIPYKGPHYDRPHHAYSICQNLIRPATNREKFLYMLYGSECLKVRGE